MVNAISSGVALAAAKMMSPSFSRSSSSTTMTALPAAMSAIARSTESRRTCRHSRPGQSWDVAPIGVRPGAGRRSRSASSFSTCLAMTSVSRLTRSPGCRRPSVVRARVSGIRLTVNASSPASTTVRLTPSTVIDPCRPGSGRAGRHRDLDDLPVLAGVAGDDGADAVHVALDDVAAEPLVRGDGALQVDPVAGLDAVQRGLVEGLLHDVGGPLRTISRSSVPGCGRCGGRSRAAVAPAGQLPVNSLRRGGMSSLGLARPVSPSRALRCRCAAASPTTLRVALDGEPRRPCWCALIKPLSPAFRVIQAG